MRYRYLEPVNRKRLTKLGLSSLVLAALTTITCLNLLDTSRSHAANTASFKPGDIMSDNVMANKKTMSQSQIQSFLKSKNSCNDTNLSKLTYHNSTYGYLDYNGVRYEYHLVNGHFICMADQDFNGESAAHIIWQAAQDYHVNPQVLIVLLQKEQGLVTDTWPNYNHQYAAATGYDCPDNGTGCNNQNAGFKNQIRKAANLFHEVLDNRDYDGDGFITNYPVGTNYIQYNPSKSCGGSYVTIKNRATSSLYRYTPYQPNAAALAASPGQTVSCGAYGNLNFWRYFNDWFGPSTIKDNYRFEKLVGPSGATNTVNSSDLGDSTKTLSVGSKIYTFYYDSSNKNLRLTLWNGSSWQTTVLDGTGATTPGATTDDVGQGISAAVWNGSIQVYYYDTTSGDLRHAWTNSNGWHAETLDGSKTSLGGSDKDVGKFSMVSIWHNGIQLYYYNVTDGSLMHAWWPGNGWRFETLDGTSSSVSGQSDDVGSEGAILNWGSGIQLYYHNSTTGNLEHTWWPGDGKWHFEILDGTTTSLGKHNANVGLNSIAVTQYGPEIQLYYDDSTNGNLIHTWWTGSTWHTETIDGTSGSIFGNDSNVGSEITLEKFQKDLFLFYYDTTTSVWRAAYYDHAWYSFPLDGASNALSLSSAPVGGQLSTTIYDNSSLQIFYQRSGALEHVWANR